MAEALVFDRLPSPLGELLIVADAAGRLRAIDWCEEERLRARLARSLGGEDFSDALLNAFLNENSLSASQLALSELATLGRRIESLKH